MAGAAAGAGGAALSAKHPSAREAELAEELARTRAQLLELQQRHRLLTTRVSMHSELLFRLLDMVVVFDMAGVMSFVSPSCSHILQYSPEELYNCPISLILADESHGPFEERVQHMVESQQHRVLHVDEALLLHKFRKKDGTEVWMEGKGQAWQRGGDAIEFVIVFRDLVATSAEPGL